MRVLKLCLFKKKKKFPHAESDAYALNIEGLRVFSSWVQRRELYIGKFWKQLIVLS